MSDNMIYCYPAVVQKMVGLLSAFLYRLSALITRSSIRLSDKNYRLSALQIIPMFKWLMPQPPKEILSCSISHPRRQPIPDRLISAYEISGYYRAPGRMNYGFTLIELVVTITVVGILAAIAVPSMNHFLESNRLVALTNDLITDINLARSEAIKNGAQTGLCAASGSNCGTSTDWGSSGWRVFQDTDNTSSWTSGDTLIRSHESAPLNNSITAPANFLVFSRVGGMVAAVTSQDITICNSRIKEKRTLSINSVGRVSITPGTC
jgi:type IV fimbrial biogenesis protein FimT